MSRRFPVRVTFQVEHDEDDDRGHVQVIEAIIRAALAEHGYLSGPIGLVPGVSTDDLDSSPPSGRQRGEHDHNTTEEER